MLIFAVSLSISPMTWWVVPSPGVPYESSPGFARASAISSFRLFAGSAGCAAMTIGTFNVWPTARKSFSGSNDMFVRSSGLMMKLGNTTRSVWPSAGERTTASAPMIVLPPGRFSMTTDWPRLFARCSPSRRADRSAAPPGGKGTTMRNCLDG